MDYVRFTKVLWLKMSKTIMRMNKNKE